MKNLKKRLNKRKKLNKYDKFNINFYNRVQKGFVKVSKNNKKYLIINSNNAIKENEQIMEQKGAQDEGLMAQTTTSTFSENTLKKNPRKFFRIDNITEKFNNLIDETVWEEQQKKVS